MSIFGNNIVVATISNVFFVVSGFKLSQDLKSANHGRFIGGVRK